MTKQIHLFRTALVAVLALALVACNKTNKAGRLIPQNASYVIHINSAQLSSKISWNELRDSEAAKEALADTTLPKYLSQVMKNPEESGIDLQKDMVGFVVVDSEGGYAGFTGGIKNADKFNTFNLDLTEGGFEREEKGIKYISKMPMIVGYDKERFVYLVNSPEMNENRRSGGKNGGASRDMQQAIADIFAMAEDKSLAKNSQFSTLVNDKADIHIWINGEALAKGSGALEELPLIDLEKFTKGNVTTASITFNNGNIGVQSRWYPSKELAAVLKKHAGKKVDATMLNNLPADGVGAVLALNFKPEAIREVLKLTGVEGLASGLLKRQTGISLEDFVKANKGDLLIAGSNLRKETKTLSFGSEPGQSVSYSTETMDFMLAASIDDKASFTKLIQAGQTKASDLGMRGSRDSGNVFAYSTNDKYFAIGNSKTAVDGYLAGGGKNSSLLPLIGGSPIGGYADIQTLLKGMGPDEKADSTDKRMHALSLQTWDNVILKGGDFEDGALLLDLQINMKDKTTNSLKQLNSYGQKMTALQAARRKAEMARFEQGDMQFTPPRIVEETVVPDVKTAPPPMPKK
jgi:hypothetical protein